MSQFDFGINLESIIQKLNHLIKEIIMSVNFKPLADRVLVEPAPAETKTASGLIIPDTAKEKPQEGVVVAVGNGESRRQGSLRKIRWTRIKIRRQRLSYHKRV